MSFLNREEVSSAIQALAAILGETEHKESLDDNFAQSVVFRKDVSDTETATGSTKTLDFLDIDYIEVTQSSGVDVSYTINNIQQGELKYLKIIKDAGDTIAFANVDNQAFDQDELDTLTEVFYVIINKDGTTLIAIPLNKDIFIASTAEAQSLTDDTKVLTPAKLADVNGGLLTKVVELGDWNMNTTTQILVNHGISNHRNIRNVSVMIRNDLGGILNMLDSISSATAGTDTNGAVATISTSQITLIRTTGGLFDATSYESTSYNRGWMTIQYVP